MTSTRTLCWLLALPALGACGVRTELISPRLDAAVAADAARDALLEAGSRTCPIPGRLSEARRMAWSTCNNTDRRASCVVATDGREVCGCRPEDGSAEVCGFALVNFVGSNADLARAECDSRTGTCRCTVGAEACECRSTAPSAACAVRTGRNCCWSDQD